MRKETMNAAQPSAVDPRLSVENAAVLLIDHQAGLLSLVQDYSPDEFRNNVLALADIAKLYKTPHDPHDQLRDGTERADHARTEGDVPDAPYIPRPGQINAWDNEDFVKAVQRRAASN
jgi:nicotinamidase-related amidase